jgi:hypothetical protein
MGPPGDIIQALHRIHQTKDGTHRFILFSIILKQHFVHALISSLTLEELIVFYYFFFKQYALTPIDNQPIELHLYTKGPLPRIRLIKW